MMEFIEQLLSLMKKGIIDQIITKVETKRHSQQILEL